MRGEVVAIEMRKLPEGWRCSTLGEECEINPRRSKDLEANDDTETSFVPMEVVDGDRGIISEIRIVPFSKVKKGYTYFEENDVLFAKITPCMQNKKSAIAKGLIGGYGFGTTEFHVLRCNERVIPKWIYYFIRNQRFIDEAENNFTGAVGQQRVPASFLGNYPIIVPPIIEQQKIVEKLDKQMAQIEIIKREVEKQNEAAKQFYHSQLNEYFHNNKEKFKKYRFVNLFEIEMGQSPPGTSYNKNNEGIPLLNGPTEFGRVHPIPIQWTTLPKKICNVGDVLLCVRGNTTGKTNKADQEYCIGRGIAAIRPKNSIIQTSIITHIVEFITEELLRRSPGSAFPNLTGITLSNFEIYLPTSEKEINRLSNIIDNIKIRHDEILHQVNSQISAINQLPNSILNEVFGQYQIQLT